MSRQSGCQTDCILLVVHEACAIRVTCKPSEEPASTAAAAGVSPAMAGIALCVP